MYYIGTYNIVLLRVSQILNPPLIGEGGGGKRDEGCRQNPPLLFRFTVVAFFNGFKPEPSRAMLSHRRSSEFRKRRTAFASRVDNSSLTPGFARRLSDLRERRDGCVASTRVRGGSFRRAVERSKRINSATSALALSH